MNLEPHSSLNVKALHDVEGSVIIVSTSKHEYLALVINAGVANATSGYPIVPYWYGGVFGLKDGIDITPSSGPYTQSIHYNQST